MSTQLLFSSFARLLRLSSLLIGIILPASWLALTTFHQNQLPIAIVSYSRSIKIGLPFPSVIEMLLMVFMFDLFREAGLRLPSAVGGTISVVGGLIIGDAAIRAGITSPAMIVIIAVFNYCNIHLSESIASYGCEYIKISFHHINSFFRIFWIFTFIIFYYSLFSQYENVRCSIFELVADLSWFNDNKNNI